MERRRNAAKSGSLFTSPGLVERSSTWAGVIYALIPFIGIVFVPIALIFLIADTRSASAVGKKSTSRTLTVIAALIAISFAQLFLWWLLYYIPTVSYTPE